MRRFLKLTAIVIPALVFSLAVVLVVYLQSSSFQELLRSRIVSELEQRFVVRAELEAAGLDWTRTAFRLRGLRLYDSQFPAPEPALELPELEVDFSLVSLLRPAATLDDLRLRGLVVRILKDPNDRLNLVNMFRKEGGPPPDLSKLILLGIRRWTLEEGLIIFDDHPLRLASSAGGMDLQVRFFPERKRYAGILKLNGVDFRAGALELAPMDVDLKFELLENSIEMPSLQISTPALRAEQSGAIVDLSELTYRFEGTVVTQPRLIRQPPLAEEFPEGEFAARGVFSGTKGDFLYRGQVRSEAFRWRDFSFGDFTARLAVDRTSLEATGLSSRFEGGRVEAEGELAWDETQQSRFQVRATDFQIARLAPWLQSPELRVRGTARAGAELSWPGLELAEISGAGTATWRGDLVLPQPPLSPAAFPFSGESPFRVSRDGVSFGEGSLQTLDSQVSLTGRVEAGGRYEVRATLAAEQGHRLVDFASLSPLWPDWMQEQPLPQLRGVSSQVQLEGEGSDFRLQGQARVQQAELRQQPLGKLHTDFSLDREHFALDYFSLEGDPHHLEGSLEVALREAEGGLQDLQLEVRQVVVQDWLALLEIDSPLEGRLSGDADVTRVALERYQGQGRFRVEAARLLDQPLESLSGRYRVDGQSLHLSSLEGRTLGGSFAGDFSYRFPEQDFTVSLTGGGLDLGQLSFWPADLAVESPARVSISAAGDLERFRLEAGLQAPRFRFGDYLFDDLELEAVRRRPTEDHLELSLRTRFLENPFVMEGQVGLDAPHPFRAELELAQLPLERYLALLPTETQVDLQGSASGRLELSGDAQDLSQLRARANFPEIELVAAGYEIRNQSPLSIQYANQQVRLEPVRFTGRETELELTGELDFRREPSVVLEVDGKVNLLILNPFLEGGTSLGSVSLETVVSGPLSNPRIVGDARIEKGFLQHPSLPTPLFDTTGRFRFTANQIGIDQLSARTSYGTVNAEGGVFLDGFRPVRWKVNLYGSGLRVEYPQEVFSTLDLDVDFLRNENSQLLSGVVYIRSAEYREQISLPELILRYTGSPAFAPSVSDEELVLDIEVEGYRTLQIDNNLAQVTASGDFKIRGTLENPVILGNLTVDEGTLFLENNEYEVTRGSITFNNPRQTRPVFNFEAETEVRDISVNILVNGPVDQLKVSFRSDPPLPTPSIISLLAVGQTQEELFGSEGQDQVGSLALFGAGAVLSKSLGQKLQAQSSRLFGFDKVSIDPFLYGSERNPGARVTLGKQLGNRVSVTYSTDLGSQTQGQLVVVELKITDWLTAVGTGEQDGALAIDFKLKKRF